MGGEDTDPSSRQTKRKEWTMNESTQRLTFLLQKEASEEFVMLLGEASIHPKRQVVKGQSIDVATVDLVKIIVALGGGAGIAVVIQRIADAIVRIMREKRTVVKLRTDRSDLSFENMSAAQVCEILRGISKPVADNAGIKKT